MARRIIRQFGEWYVTTTGIWHKRMDYQINFEWMGDNSWLSHIADKPWGDFLEFSMAWGFVKSFEFQQEMELIAEKRRKQKKEKKSTPKLNDARSDRHLLGIQSVSTRRQTHTC